MGRLRLSFGLSEWQLCSMEWHYNPDGAGIRFPRRECYLTEKPNQENRMSRFGMHIDPPLGLIPQRLKDRGCVVFQTILRDPMRLSKEGIPDAADQAAYR